MACTSGVHLTVVTMVLERSPPVLTCQWRKPAESTAHSFQLASGIQGLLDNLPKTHWGF